MSTSPDALITDARNYVATLVAPAEAALTSTISSLQLLGYSQISYNPTVLTPPPLPNAPTVPTFDTVTVTLGEPPSDDIAFQDITLLDIGEVPVDNTSAPTISLPNAPTMPQAFTITPPSIDTDIEFPVVPAELSNPLIDAPVIPQREAPTAPTVVVPQFDAVLPQDAPTAPTGLDATFEAKYRSMAPNAIAMANGYVDSFITKYSPNFPAHMAALETQLQKYLDGGTALNPAIEDAIYARGRSKRNADARRMQDASLEDFAERGFPLPPLALAAAQQKARQDASNANADATREIAIAQAEMEQKNLQFAVTQSANLRTGLMQIAMSYMNGIVTLNGQAIEYGKSVASLLVESFNVARAAYASQLDAYRAEAAVYETKLKSALAAVDLYKAEIEALLALTNVDRAQVEVYRARIDTLRARAEVYRATIDAIQGRAGLEKLKLELFGVQVQGFTATVQAKDAECRVYEAGVRGETAKTELYSAGVRAYGTRVEAYKATVEAKARAVDAAATTNRSRGEVLTARVNAYKATVEAKGEIAKTQIENQRLKLYAFQASNEALIAFSKTRSDFYHVQADVQTRQAEVAIGAMFRSAELARSYGESIAKAYTGYANIHGTLAGSALAGINSLAASTISA